MKRLQYLLVVALPGLLQAQPVPYGLSVDRDHVRIAQPVEVVVNFGAASPWCGLRVELGDGDVREILVEDFPLRLTKQYAAAGRYVVRAEGRFVARGIQSAPGCVGAPRALMVVVGDDMSNAPAYRPDAVERRNREREERRDVPNRDPGIAADRAPMTVPTAPRAAAPAASRPRDGTLKVF
jgi:hypothetical protein